MKSEEVRKITNEIKKNINNVLVDVKKLKIDEKLKGFSKKAETSKREGYYAGLEVAIKIVEAVGMTIENNIKKETQFL